MLSAKDANLTTRVRRQELLEDRKDGVNKRLDYIYSRISEATQQGRYETQIIIGSATDELITSLIIESLRAAGYSVEMQRVQRRTVEGKNITIDEYYIKWETVIHND